MENENQKISQKGTEYISKDRTTGYNHMLRNNFFAAIRKTKFFTYSRSIRSFI